MEQNKNIMGETENKRNKIYIGLSIIGAGVIGFIIGNKFSEFRITRGMYRIFSQYPDVEKQMFETLNDYASKNNIKTRISV